MHEVQNMRSKVHNRNLNYTDVFRDVTCRFTFKNNNYTRSNNNNSNDRSRLCVSNNYGHDVFYTYRTCAAQHYVTLRARVPTTRRVGTFSSGTRRSWKHRNPSRRTNNNNVMPAHRTRVAALASRPVPRPPPPPPPLRRTRGGSARVQEDVVALVRLRQLWRPPLLPEPVPRRTAKGDTGGVRSRRGDYFLCHTRGGGDDARTDGRTDHVTQHTDGPQRNRVAPVRRDDPARESQPYRVHARNACYVCGHTQA